MDDGFFLQRASHHLADEFRFRDILDFLRGHPLPVAKNRHTIRESEDFIEPVTDINDCRAAGAEVANDSEETLDVVLRQHGGGLVENKHARLQGERLGNFHALPVADRQAAGSSSHIDIRGVQGLEQLSPPRVRRDASPEQTLPGSSGYGLRKCSQPRLARDRD